MSRPPPLSSDGGRRCQVPPGLRAAEQRLVQVAGIGAVGAQCVRSYHWLSEQGQYRVQQVVKELQLRDPVSVADPVPDRQDGEHDRPVRPLWS